MTTSSTKALDIAGAEQTRGTSKILCWVCLVAGFVSILGSIAIWYHAGGTTSSDPIVTAHAERFGIFVGLWAPTFFILSNRFDRAAQIGF